MKTISKPLLVMSMITTVFAATSTLPNPGFEDAAQKWDLRDAMAKVVPDAAHAGKNGLRIDDADATAGTSVVSAKVPVKAGQQVKATFWARTKTNCSSVYLWFFDASSKVIKDPALKDSEGLVSTIVKQTDGTWHDYTVSGKAPAGAVSVAIWVHSFSAPTGSVDLDDFALAIE